MSNYINHGHTMSQNNKGHIRSYKALNKKGQIR